MYNPKITKQYSNIDARKRQASFRKKLKVPEMHLKTQDKQHTSARLTCNFADTRNTHAQALLAKSFPTLALRIHTAAIFSVMVLCCKNIAPSL